VIVTRLMGGLGNQMFQYALGRRLAYDRRVPLKLDLSWFRDSSKTGVDTSREYALDRWRIQASIATAEDLACFTGRQSLLGRLGLSFPPVVRERGPKFDERVLRVPSTVHLTGYWQSEKYFRPIREMLLREFTLAAAPCPHAVAILSQAREVPAVAVHVRRGDYANHPHTNEYHGLCSIEYYQEAARRIAEQVPGATFFFFSDDPDWVRDNLKLDWPMIQVTHDGGCAPHEDMWLMSQCSHHIVANSSFSWWGAWLCQREDKIVIAPSQWFRNPKIDTSDLIPEGWTRI
jgi:Glycosyl transferase family 11